MTNYPYKIVRDIRNFQDKGKVKQFMTTEQNFKEYSKNLFKYLSYILMKYSQQNHIVLITLKHQ